MRRRRRTPKEYFTETATNKRVRNVDKGDESGEDKHDDWSVTSEQILDGLRKSLRKPSKICLLVTLSSFSNSFISRISRILFCKIFQNFKVK
jgi:hypothetical protein